MAARKPSLRAYPCTVSLSKMRSLSKMVRLRVSSSTLTSSRVSRSACCNSPSAAAGTRPGGSEPATTKSPGLRAAKV